MPPANYFAKSQVFNATLVAQITEQLLYVKCAARSTYSAESNVSTGKWYFTRHQMLQLEDKNKCSNFST